MFQTNGLKFNDASSIGRISSNVVCVTEKDNHVKVFFYFVIIIIELSFIKNNLSINMLKLTTKN